MEEERRLAYVAFTRAKKQLLISDTQGYSFVMDNIRRTSRFINEIDEDCIIHLGQVNQANRPLPQSIEEKKSNALPSSETPKAGTRIRKGALVVHASFGEGVVIDTSNGIWKIAFNQKFGIRKIAANHPSITKK